MSKTSKETARKAIGQAIAKMDEGTRTRAAESAADALMAGGLWKDSDCVLAYLAFGTEMDTDGVIKKALDEGKEVFVPRVDGKKMSFHRIVSVDGPFERGVFGIRQPPMSNEVWTPATATPRRTTLVLVPGRAFDSKGARLGRGGGYYDRFISSCRNASYRHDSGGESQNGNIAFIGYAYAVQIIDFVPTGPHDQSIDGMATENGFTRFLSG